MKGFAPLTLLLSCVAWAQDPEPAPPPSRAQLVADGIARSIEDDLKPRFFVRAGAEVTGFIGPLARGVDVGPGWNVAGGTELIHLFDFEAGYSGSVQTLSSALVRAPGSAPRYLREGGQLTFGICLGMFPVEPFVELGVAVTHYSALGGSVPGLPTGLTAGMPVIAGIKTKVLNEHLLLDLRGTYVVEGLQTVGLTNRWSFALTAGYNWH